MALAVKGPFSLVAGFVGEPEVLAMLRDVTGLRVVTSAVPSAVDVGPMTAAPSA